MMGMPSVLKMASVASAGDESGRELAQHIADRRGAFPGFDVVRMQAVNFSSPPISRRAMNTSMKVIEQDGGDASTGLDPVDLRRTTAPLWSRRWSSQRSGRQGARN